MNNLVIEALSDSWASQQDLRARVVSWQWFEAASQHAIEQAAARQALSVQVDTEILCRAFFDWAHAVDRQDHLESRAPLDFRHAMAGLLLQQLFAAHGATRGRPLLRSNPTDAAARPTGDGTGWVLTSVALTLLQGLRLDAKATPISLDTDLPGYWHSFLENAAQDPATAICFLDRMTGLAPVWQAPTAIGSRPAMQVAANAA